MEAGEQFFIAQAGAETLGFSSHKVLHSEHRTAVYVRASGTRQGIGSALFRRAESAAIAAGGRSLYVDSSLAAVEFYRNCGFKEIGRGEHALPSGRAMPCVFMRKTLAAGDSVG
jgi:ribosomal protein S18 acetylase RimI-like enzyme